MNTINQGPRTGVLASDAGSVRVLTLNRPERRNAIDIADRTQLIELLDAANDDRDVRAVVITGRGKLFCAGGEVASMIDDPEGHGHRLELGARLARTLITLGKPVVCAVEGGAYGLGLSVMSACDYAVASSDAIFEASFARLGLIGDTGIFWSLQARIGAGGARLMLMTGQRWDASKALQRGLIDQMTAPGGALTAAMDVAQALSSKPAGMITATKAILAQRDQSLEAVLQAEREHQTELLVSPEFRQLAGEFLKR